MSRKRVTPLDATGRTELVVAVVGSVDAGKSSIIGALVNNILDDGKGLARSSVFVHPHERSTGRTSDVSYQYMQLEPNRIITFVDLAGHEAYLRTTMSGLTAAAPDFAIVCISDKITRMTTEHMLLCYALNIPFMILFTKTDIVPKDIQTYTVNCTRRLVTSQKNKLYELRDLLDCKILNHSAIIPYIHISSKTGHGLDLVKCVLSKCSTRQKIMPDGFVVERVYNVPGHGTVLSGYAGHDLSILDELYMGPINNEFIKVNIRSIHNDYRYEMKTLSAGARGCVSVGLRHNKKRLRTGIILSRKPPKVCREFMAEINIVHHSTHIKPGYNAFINCGMLREPVEFLELYINDKPAEFARSGDIVRAKLRFQNTSCYICQGQQIAFREGLVRGFGRVCQLFFVKHLI